MVDDRIKKHRPDDSPPALDLGSRPLASTNEEDSRQRQRDVVLLYAQHLVKDYEEKGTLSADDLTTLLRVCKQRLAGGPMLRALKPEVLPIIVDHLLPALPKKDRDTMELALAKLSDDPLWQQAMVNLGYACEVCAPNTFREYEDFIEALRAIDEGRWHFDPEQIRRLSGANLEFTEKVNADIHHQELYHRISSRYYQIQEAKRKKFGPGWD
jgi:hypothetical protein